MLVEIIEAARERSEKVKDYDERAETLKDEANKFFKEQDYDAAIALYSLALDFNKTAMIDFWQSLNGVFEETLEDADKALELDSSYVKGYYRRATAHMALGRFKKALKDYETVKKARPNDKDASEKFAECAKIVKLIAFEKAISCDHDKKSVADLIDIEKILVEDSYKGPHLDGPVTPEFMTELITTVKEQGALHRKYAYKVNQFQALQGTVDFQILLDIYAYFKTQPTLVDIKIADTQRDCHGGLFKEDGVTLDAIRNVDRVRQPPEDGIMCLIHKASTAAVHQSVALAASSVLTSARNAKKRVQVANIIMDECTLFFSAPNYCDQVGNNGAFINVRGDNLTPRVTSFSAVPHPNVPPMAYGNSLFGFC